MTLNTVVFPQPDGPMMLTKSCSLMSNDNPPSTSTEPCLLEKDFRMFRNASCTDMLILVLNLNHFALRLRARSAQSRYTVG